MPVIVKTMVKDARIKIDVANMSVTQTESQKPQKLLYRLDFAHQYHMLDPRDNKRIAETYEYLCWLQSPVREQAEQIGWTSDKSRLPIYDNNQLFLDHKTYSRLPQWFLHNYLSHVQCLHPTSRDYTSGNVGRGGRNAA